MKVVATLATASLAASVSAAKVPSKVQDRSTGSSTGSSSLPTVTTKGNAFYAGSERFYLRGVDYQPGDASSPVDPLATYSTCSRDIAYFKELGLNTIRVYTVDNSANHDECMAALAEAGIYLVLDVNSPLYSLNRDDPGESYNPTYLQSVFATIDNFAGYTNTLVFLSGNEVINAPNTTNTAPYIKAVTRDMKQYIGERGYRPIPVGYSAADVSQNQYLLAQYLDCGEEQTRADFYAINNYEWCYPSSFTQSGWNTLVEQYANYSLPVFLSEYGCVTNGRNFEETKALYQTDMTSAISGGNVYQYSEPGNDFSIVNINGNTVTPIGQQFNDLKEAFASTPNPSGNGGAHGPTAPQECPAASENWDIKPFSGSALPAMPSGALQYLQNGAGKGPGLTGAGSQDAPGGSTVTASANAGQVTATLGPGATSTGGVTDNGSSSSSSGASSLLGSSDFKPLMVAGVAMAASFALGTFAL